MTTFTKYIAGAAAPVLALTMLAATPADAQNRYRDYDRGDDNTAENALLGAVVGGLAGAILGEGDGRYVAGGALAGAALGAASSSNDRYGNYGNYGRSNQGYSSGYYVRSNGDCGYYQGGRCYRNQGHWEREHGINSRDGYNRREVRRYTQAERRDTRYDRRDQRRDYRYDRRW